MSVTGKIILAILLILSISTIIYSIYLIFRAINKGINKSRLTRVFILYFIWIVVGFFIINGDIYNLLKL